MKIPFNIKFRPQIESGEYKVVTRFDNPVTILTFDKPGKYPIVCYQSNIPEPNVFCTNLCGEVDTRRGASTHADLFIVTPKPEFTDWERFISGCLQKHGLLDCGAADRIAKECSAALLDLARKELEQERPSIIQAQSFNAGLKQGKAEALKDLPRWKKAKEYIKLGPNDFCFTLDNNGKTSPYYDTEIEKGQYYITESDIENLPKED